MKFDSASGRASIIENGKALSDLNHEGAGEQVIVTPTDAVVEEVQGLLQKEWSNTEFTDKTRPKSSKSRKRQPAQRNSKSSENAR